MLYRILFPKVLQSRHGNRNRTLKFKDLKGGYSMKLSQYNHIIPHNDEMLIFNAYRRGLHIIDQVTFNSLTLLEHNNPAWNSQIDDKTYQILLSNGYIISDEVDEHQQILNGRLAIQNSHRSIDLTIAPTIDCNFGCPYCFEGGDKPQERMSAEVMISVVHFIKHLQNEDTQYINVTWFGGEPLLAMTQITQLTNLIQSSLDDSIQFNASVITNGYGLTRKIAQKLVDLHVHSAQITLDGTEEFHDARRFRLGGHPTFSQIVDNITNVYDLIQISIRVNVDKTNMHSFPELVKDLNSRGLKDKVSIYPAFTREAQTGWNASYNNMRDYTQEKINIHRQAMQHGVHMLSYPSAVRLFCGSTRPTSWVIHPNGDLHKCWDTINEQTEAVGNLITEEMNETKLEKWVNWSPFNHEQCKRCNVMPLCMGGCAHLAFQNNGVPQCEEWKYGLHDAIKVWIEDRSRAKIVSKNLITGENTI